MAGLLQWGDFAEWFRTLGAIPRFNEFFPVQGCPLLYKAARSWWKPTLGYDPEVYIYRSFVFTVSGMEVGWVVVEDVDADRDAVESAEFRHGCREATEPCRA